jgi:hypothetical protein
LWVFETPRGEYGLPDPELGHRNAATVTLKAVAPRPGTRLRYLYDFGDDWEHDITLEKIIPAGADMTGAICTAGSGACPPEDCGGAWGYQELKTTLADPNADEHESMLEWLGLASPGDFDPRSFSAEEVNRRLDRSIRQRLRAVR